MSVQTWKPLDYARHAGFVAELGSDLIGLLDLAPSSVVLDLGCGDGALTVKLQERGYRVVGVDSSAPQIAAARARGIDARVADGEALDFNGEFDAVLSNAALHWMKRPQAVLAGVWRGLRPGGCFVGEMGGVGNVGSVVRAAEAVLAARGIDPAPYNPWFFPSVDTYQALLEAQGFVLEFIMLFARPTALAGEVGHWLRLFAQSFAAAVPTAQADQFYDEVQSRLAPERCDADGRWILDYMRLRFKVRRPT